MKILGIDTSTKFLSLSLYDDGKLAEYSLEAGTRLSALLSLTIKRAVEALNWRMEGIDYFACGLGPGSFTGLRVGLATIKAMSWSLKKPIIGVPTLDIIARAALNFDTTVAPIIDAKRGLIYTAFYRMHRRGMVRRTPYLLLTKQELAKKAKDNTVFMGDALVLYRDEILLRVNGARLLDKDYWFPLGHNLISLALEKIKEKKSDNPFDIKPIYIYPKECQIRKIKTL